MRMQAKPWIGAALAAGLALASPGAAAQNWIGLLKNTAAEQFDETDMRLFLDNSRKVLNETPDNQTLSWENPATRHRGDATVLRSFKYKDLSCKELRVRNEANGRKGDNKFSLCSVEGRWRLLSPSQTKKL